MDPSKAQVPSSIQVHAQDVRARARASLIKRTLLVAGLVLGIAALVWAFLPKPVAVETATVQRATLRVSVEEDGKARVKDRYLVSSPLLSNLARIELSAGDEVAPDTVLARLLPLSPTLLDPRSRAELEERLAASSAAERQSHAAVARASAALEYAKREAARLTALQARGAAPDRAVEQAQLEIRTLAESLTSAEFGAKVADHELAMARAALGVFDPSSKREAEVMEVRSPIAGRVLRIVQQSEAVVQPGAALLELGDPAALEIVVDVLTTDAVRIAPGTRALISRWGGDAVLEGHVRLVEPSAFTKVSALGVEEQRVNVVIDLDSPRTQWTSLGDGYRVEAELITWEAAGRSCAPASAVFRRGDGFAVFRVADGRAHLTPIRVGRQNDDLVEIESGLPDGAVVIVHPSDRIEDGTAVAP